MKSSYYVALPLFGVVAVLALASTMIMAPVFAQEIVTATIEKNSDFSLSASFHVEGAADTQTVGFLTSSGGDISFKCLKDKDKDKAPPSKETSFKGLQGESKELPFPNGQFDSSVSMDPPSLSASDLCHNSKSNVIIESITYNDVVLHLQVDGEDEDTHEFGTVDP